LQGLGFGSLVCFLQGLGVWAYGGKSLSLLVLPSREKNMEWWLFHLVHLTHYSSFSSQLKNIKYENLK
jgi:hypothetical protein